ncbi:Na+/H+ antiporter NhaC family protein [Pontibacillus yanchengensis]|uniref:Sodium:proton antiporter n=1 Tax=Pontibacillus yanchengensis Y32 TaxID=1385514 RepID=A0A0A2TB61_9BACI|nr:Na+/H+ antiporter NhaC family protein [Pontibacillus yanchengensis]KGP73067.1 sodium:proton antiporter [Pontibacillus yanchengensis Y32]
MNKSFSLLEVVLIFTVTVSFLMMAISFDGPLYLAMIPGIVLLCGFGIKHGYTMNQFVHSSWKGVKRNKDVAWLLFFIGVLLPTWYFSGTIHDLNELFLSFISPSYFFTFAFLIVAMMSMVVGSSIASLSIVGVPLMAAADQIGLPVPVVAGALVSGGFVGDRSSPISSSFQLLRMSVEIDTKSHFRSIAPTLAWGVILSILIFLAMDFVIAKEQLTLNEVTPFSQLNYGSIGVSLLPPFTLLLMILFGQEMKFSFSLGIGTAIVILFVRGVAPMEWLEGLYFGVDALSGVRDMLPFVLFILVVGAYCQIMEDTKIIQPYIEKIFTDNRSLQKNTAQSIAVAAGASLISPNQSFPIILTGRTLMPYWEKNFSKAHLSRILADSTVVFAGLVPWSLLAILCSTIVGVPVLSYAPFAVFLLLMPVITFIYSGIVSKKNASGLKHVLQQ